MKHRRHVVAAAAGIVGFVVGLNGSCSWSTCYSSPTS